MRYIAGLCYGIAASGGRGLLDLAVVGGLVFVGTVALVFAVENIITHRFGERA